MFRASFSRSKINWQQGEGEVHSPETAMTFRAIFYGINIGYRTDMLQWALKVYSVAAEK
jgi:hypothetical protein